MWASSGGAAAEKPGRNELPEKAVGRGNAHISRGEESATKGTG